METEDFLLISVVIAITILVLLVFSIAIIFCVIYKRKQSLCSLHHDLAAAANVDHPPGYAEAMHLDEIKTDDHESTHQSEMVDMLKTASHSADSAGDY